MSGENSSGGGNNISPEQQHLESYPHPQWLSTVRRSGYQKCVKALSDFFKNPQTRNVLKCSIGYLIASLGVYTEIRNLYGRSDSKHLIATTVVYFNPGRTKGSMVEATIFAFFSLAYGLLCAYLSMVVSSIFSQLDLKYLGYAIDICVFCAVGLGAIAYMKQKVNKPTFTTACSLASIFLINILTKEGNVQAGVLSFKKLFQSFFFVLTGVIISAVVCITLWPTSSIRQLKGSLNKTTDVYSVMLDYISENFINRSDINTERFNQLNSQVTQCFNDLDKSMESAKYELYVSGREKEIPYLRRLVASNHRLALLMGGLSSSAKTQQHLLNHDSSGSTTVDPSNEHSSGSSSDADSVASFEAVTAQYSHDALPDLAQQKQQQQQDDTSAELFSVFIYHLGPPLRSFSYTVRGILDGMPFGDAPDYPVSLNVQYKKSLSLATKLYSQAREKALVRLYSQEIFQTNNTDEQDFDTAADEEGVAASCGNFSYVLEAFGNELKLFIEALEDYEQALENDKRSFEWIKFWKKYKRQPELPVWADEGSSQQQEQQQRQQTVSMNYINSNKNRDPFDLKNEFSSNLKAYNSSKKDAPFKLKLWRNLHIFRRTDVQFGIKVGVGAAIFAVPAFLDKFRPLFGLWRGEWGLITYAIIMNKSVGGTTKTVPYRIVGTFLGAFLAFIFWTMFPGQEYTLALIGFLISMPCFYIILYWKDNNPFGRFILLTFNLTALYSYSLTADDKERGDEREGGIHPVVRDIAFHRFVSVFVGVLWALFITVLILPNTARRKLRQVLCVQWLRMGLIWKADPFRIEEYWQELPPDETSTTALQQHHQANLSGIQGENLLQTTMIQLQTLLSQAPLEFRLKGPYPVEDYKAILISTQQILDAFQNMSVLISKYRAPSKREMELIKYTSQERKELSSRIFLFFYLASSAMKLGFPLPDKLPSTDHAIDRMLAKLNEFRIQNTEEILKSNLSGKSPELDDDKLNEEDFVLFYSYILVTITISEELAKIALHIQNLFGVIEDELFETS